MVAAGFDGVEFIIANTDLQALHLNTAPNKLQIGAKLSKGLGAGADPNVGRQAALGDTEKLIEALDGADMVFVTTGLGGGTGTGAAPVIASLASELGALTIAVVTKPFKFEGEKRPEQAERGLEALSGGADLSLIEVSEASAIIQEAAHEEANIIFGAVVDPNMHGKVKITVIATGFDRAVAEKQATVAAAPTPVDLHSYTAWQATERVAMPAAAAAGGGSRLTVSRRPVLEMPAAAAAADPGLETFSPG